MDYYLDVEKHEQNHLWKKTCQNHSGSDPKKIANFTSNSKTSTLFGSK